MECYFSIFSFHSIYIYRIEPYWIWKIVFPLSFLISVIKKDCIRSEIHSDLFIKSVDRIFCGQKKVGETIVEMPLWKWDTVHILMIHKIELYSTEIESKREWVYSYYSTWRWGDWRRTRPLLPPWGRRSARRGRSLGWSGSTLGRESRCGAVAVRGAGHQRRGARLVRRRHRVALSRSMKTFVTYQFKVGKQSKSEVHLMDIEQNHSNLEQNLPFPFNII